MPSRITLTLRPCDPSGPTDRGRAGRPERSGRTTGGDGPALQAAFLEIVAHHHPVLADLLHQPGQQVRPYSLTTTRPDHDNLVAMELGFLADGIVPDIVDALDQVDHLTTLNATRRYELVRGDVYTLTWDELHHVPTPTASWRIELISPFMLRRPGRDGGPERVDVLPEPEPFLHRLASRHDVFSPLPLPAPIDQWADRVVIARIDQLTTALHLVETKRRPVRYRGCVGTFDVELLRPTDDETRSLCILLHLANFTGIGDRTTVGMGHARCAPTPVGRHSDHGGDRRGTSTRRR